MLLSDGDLRKDIESGRLVLDPWDVEMLQPSSVDVRLDRYFRVFQNSRYTHIDPSQQQDELTTPVETPDGESFVLHPGEFVLARSLRERAQVALAVALAAVGYTNLGRDHLDFHPTMEDYFQAKSRLFDPRWCRVAVVNTDDDDEV